jgi:hypothetical protein
LDSRRGGRIHGALMGNMYSRQETARENYFALAFFTLSV